MRRRTGDNREEGTPVPIPNTEVKLFSSNNTVWATAWEDRKSPFHPLTWAVFSCPVFCYVRLARDRASVSHEKEVIERDHL